MLIISTLTANRSRESRHKSPPPSRCSSRSHSPCPSSTLKYPEIKSTSKKQSTTEISTAAINPSRTPLSIDSSTQIQNEFTSISADISDNYSSTYSGTIKYNCSEWSTEQTHLSSSVSNTFISNDTLTANQEWMTLQTEGGIFGFTTLIDDVTSIGNSIVTTELPRVPPDGILVYIIVYGCIVSVGLLCNILAILAILLLQKLRTAQNMFVLNLCFADILLGINALFAFIAEVGDGFDFEEHSGECQILGFITFIPPIAVVLSMTVIARNRHKTIAGMYPNNLMFNKKRVTLYLFIVWIIAIVIALPILIAEMDTMTGLFCTCCFSFSTNKAYGFTVTLFMSIIPNYIILYSYVCIFVIFHKSRKRIREFSTSISSNSNTLKKGDLQLAIQFILLFALFNVCYLPTMIVFWLEDYESIPGGCRAFIMILYASNIIANPIAYFIMNKTARHELKRLFCNNSVSPESDRTHHSVIIQHLSPNNVKKLEDTSKSRRIHNKNNNTEENNGNDNPINASLTTTETPQRSENLSTSALNPSALLHRGKDSEPKISSKDHTYFDLPNVVDHKENVHEISW